MEERLLLFAKNMCILNPARLLWVAALAKVREFANATDQSIERLCSLCRKFAALNHALCDTFVYSPLNSDLEQ